MENSLLAALYYTKLNAMGQQPGNNNQVTINPIKMEKGFSPSGNTAW